MGSGLFWKYIIFVRKIFSQVKKKIKNFLKNVKQGFKTSMGYEFCFLNKLKRLLFSELAVVIDTLKLAFLGL